MKLASYTVDGKAAVGVQVAEGRIAPLSEVWKGRSGEAPAGMLELIEQWDSAAPSVDLASVADEVTEAVDVLDSEARWLPPVPRPSKIFGVALNNKTLFDRASSGPSHPALFSYPPSALVGHQSPIELRADYGVTHPEPELGVVIGRRAKRVPVEQALDHVFGYTIVDDVTSPELKAEDTVVIPRPSADALPTNDQAARAQMVGFEHGALQLTYHARSKGTDTFAPCGPWIVTKDEIPDPNALAVRLIIDGELCMEDNTGNLMYSVAEVVSHASNFFTLEPGDILHVGTAGRGKYQLRELNYQWRIGQTRTIEIDSIGALVNPIQQVD